MLENIGPVPKFELMINLETIRQEKQEECGNVYKNVFKNINFDIKNFRSKEH